MSKTEIQAKIQSMAPAVVGRPITLSDVSSDNANEYLYLRNELYKRERAQRNRVANAERSAKREAIIATEQDGGTVSEAVCEDAGETNSCGVYALSTALNITYGEAHKRLADVGRKIGRGSHIRDNATALGLVEVPVPATTIGQCMRLLPTGRYMVLVRKHALAIVDGNMVDSLTTWRATTERRVKNIYVAAPTLATI